MNPVEKAKMEQAFASFQEYIPNLRGFYVRCTKEGFTEEQAFSMTMLMLTRLMMDLGYKGEPGVGS